MKEGTANEEIAFSAFELCALVLDAVVHGMQEESG
jgi:hypothetical protein